MLIKVTVRGKGSKERKRGIRIALCKISRDVLVLARDIEATVPGRGSKAEEPGIKHNLPMSLGSDNEGTVPGKESKEKNSTSSIA